MKFNIVKEAGIFEIRYWEESNYLPNSKNSTAYNVIDINHSNILDFNCTHKYLFCKLRSDKVYLVDDRAYYLNPNIQGSWWGASNCNNTWELTLKVKSLSSESYTSFVIHANRGWFSNIEQLYYSIGKSICDFLNKLSMFESLEDFKEYEEIIETTEKEVQHKRRLLE
ncbi:MAG: hypothetical protein K2K26_08270, partial [Muribaculaceae bacterium]|nr:hypothetical protein [Muribaculaceae bacterium]